METKTKFIGIDFSKATFDATVYEGEHCKFTNDEQGFKEFLAWVEANIGGLSLQDCLFCGENTGSYSVRLSNFLYVHHCAMWLESALRIKRTMGLVRGKDDKTDSAYIARYAARNAADAVYYEPCCENIGELRRLFTRRKLLVSQRTALMNASKEAKALGAKSKYDRAIERQSAKLIAMLAKEIQHIEKMMLEVIEADERLCRQYQHITSVKGIGKVNAVALISVTMGFTKYCSDAKKLACHAGVAPFRKESGTSVNGGTHVSHLSNHTLKPLLTQAALTAIMYNPRIAEYYERLISRGKKGQVALNNVKNKLLHIVIGLIRKDEDYDIQYQPVSKNITFIKENLMEKICSEP